MVALLVFLFASLAALRPTSFFFLLHECEKLRTTTDLLQGRSPLGKLGSRFRQHLPPLSVHAIEIYRKAGTRRPLEQDDY
jgi:hypothetical protein